MDKKLYDLPDLPYAYNALEPYISEQLLILHHDKHHRAYVNSANAILQKPWDVKDAKALSFNVGGHILHSIFWQIMMPSKKENMPEGKILKAIEENFDSFEEFKKQFSETALAVEGSGWAALLSDGEGRLLVSQIEKHNVNIFPGHKIILPLDVWEHAYYLDYKNERAKFVENFWNLINWKEVEQSMRSN